MYVFVFLKFDMFNDHKSRNLKVFLRPHLYHTRKSLIDEDSPTATWTYIILHNFNLSLDVV